MIAPAPPPTRPPAANLDRPGITIRPLNIVLVGVVGLALWAAIIALALYLIPGP